MIFTLNVVWCDTLETFSLLRMGPKAVAVATTPITTAKNVVRKRKREEIHQFQMLPVGVGLVCQARAQATG